MNGSLTILNWFDSAAPFFKAAERKQIIACPLSFVSRTDGGTFFIGLLFMSSLQSFGRLPMERGSVAMLLPHRDNASSLERLPILSGNDVRPTSWAWSVSISGQYSMMASMEALVAILYREKSRNVILGLFLRTTAVMPSSITSTNPGKYSIVRCRQAMLPDDRPQCSIRDLRAPEIDTSDLVTLRMVYAGNYLFGTIVIDLCLMLAEIQCLCFFLLNPNPRKPPSLYWRMSSSI